MTPPRVVWTLDRIRSLSAVDEHGCWIWTRMRTHNGYGLVTVRSEATKSGTTSTTAHRLAYQLAHGPVADGLQLDHLCRNRACVNPDHLEPVTAGENVSRALAANGLDTHCRRGHEWTPENTRVYGDGYYRRICLACNRMRGQAYKARLRAAHALKGEQATA